MSEVQQRERTDRVESVPVELAQMFMAMGPRQRRDLRTFLRESHWPEIRVVLTTDPDTGEVALLLDGPTRARSPRPGPGS